MVHHVCLDFTCMSHGIGARATHVALPAVIEHWLRDSAVGPAI